MVSGLDTFEKEKRRVEKMSTPLLKKNIARRFNVDFRAIGRAELRRRGVSESKIPGSRLRRTPRQTSPFGSFRF